ncbi:uncharacterized protein LOC107845308 [Capsicum annuum]|uniref:uncharacterized protein LOC107845308 n=1 Tax=Capsicum annuum TaxID=4072 RepID=UPI001FB08A94|nr:uncharacterized protein LOC107845308 [Capsicum annuum]
MKIRDGKEVWIETQAEETYNRYVQAIKELKKNRSIDDQGNPIMLTEEETLSCWLDVVGGVYKGRAYGLCSEENFHRLQCGLQGIEGSTTMPDEQLEEMQQEVRELARKYEEERKRRMDEERRRTILESDVQELKAQVNTLIKLPRSLPPSSNDDGEEDEDDGEDKMDY